jgi:hypothetical protein
MVSGDFGTHVDEAIRGHAELSDLALGLDMSLGKMAAHGSGGPLGLGRAGTELNGGVAVLVGGALRHDLQIVELQDCHRNLGSVFQKQPGHAQLLCDYARAHVHALLKL